MFYWISKVFSYLLAPSLWVLALFLWVLLGLNKRRAKTKGFIALAILYLLMNPFLVDELMRCWELPMQNAVFIREGYPVAVVLGGHMVTYDHAIQRRIFQTPADRIIQGLELYKQGKLGALLLSGGPSHPLHKQEFEAVWLRDFLLVAGVPKEDIWVDSTSRNTHENATHTATILQEKMYTGPVLLITSAAHMRRALGCFREEGMDVVPYVTDKIVGTRRFDLEHLLVPDTESLIKWRILTHEMLGYLAYRMAGYL